MIKPCGKQSLETYLNKTFYFFITEKRIYKKVRQLAQSFKYLKA